MPPKHNHNTRSTSRLPSGEDTEEEHDYESALEEESDDNGDGDATLDSTMVNTNEAMVVNMAKLMKQMQDKQDKREEMHEMQMKTMLDTIERLQMSNNQVHGREDTTRAKKTDCPCLGPCNEIRMEDFRAWQESFMGYASLTKLDSECSLMGRRTIVRNALDPSWQKLWSSQMLNIGINDDVDTIMNKLKEYVRSKRNPLLDRQDFYSRNQRLGESVDDYMAELKLLYESCDFMEMTKTCNHCGDSYISDEKVNLKKERLRDRLIFGLCDEEIQRKVLEEPFNTLTLERCFKIVQAAEAARATTRDLRSETDINYIKRKSSYKKRFTQGMRDTKCEKCGNQHNKDSCPAYNSRCYNCNTIGHWDKCCPNKKLQQDIKKLNSIQISHIGITKQMSPIVELQTCIGNKYKILKWLLDSGAQACVMSPEHASLFGNVRPKYSSTKLLMADQGKVRMSGFLDANIIYEGKSFKTKVYIVPKIKTPILSYEGLKALEFLNPQWPTKKLTVKALSLGKKECRQEVVLHDKDDNSDLREKLFKEFPEVFPDDKTILPLKEMSGPPMEIQLETNAKPFKRYKANTIPFALQSKVKKQLEIMEQKDVIEEVPIGEVGEWVLPMVPMQKQGTDEVRITIDCTPLNKYVKRQGYATKIPSEEVAQIPSGMVYFTTLDGRHGYWQVPLGKKSRHLTTFLTPWGHYRFKRNCMGLINAGDEHNARGDVAIKGIDNVKKIVEDIVIYDYDYDTHIRRVKEVLKRCEEHGITLSRRKAHIAQKVVQWCGYTLSEAGYTATPKLIEALSSFPVPKNRTDVRSFNGLVQQFEALSPDLTEMMTPIRALLSPKVTFQWLQDQQEAFSKIKKEFESPRILTMFRAGASLRLETDAAQKTGFGFALWQEEDGGIWKLLRCGSRTVSDAESRYSVTESELMAVVNAVKKLNLYLDGRHFTLIVDHQPLISIINEKCLDEISSPRILNLKSKLSKYNITAVWRAGIKHTVADVFSRYPVSEPTHDDLDINDDNENEMAKCILNQVTVADNILDEVREKCEQDDLLCKLKNTIVNGFPKRKQDIPQLAAFWGIRHELTVKDDLILYGNRIIIPQTMRKDILHKLHAAHQGRDRVLNRARQIVFWPGISNDVSNMVRRCNQCELNKASHRPQPLLQDVLPTRPGEAIAADLFSCEAREYMVIVDKYSSWIEVYDFNRGVCSKDVEKAFVKFFMTMGVPNRITTDNGPQFRSEEFKQFCRHWGIIFDPSSPYNHQSNGYAESAVNAAKSLVKKICPGKTVNCAEFMEALIEHRNTPKQDGLSPAERLFHRPMRTRLPSHPQIFSAPIRERIRKADQKAVLLRKKAKEQYDKGASKLPALKVGDVVRVQHHITKKWNLIAEIMEMKARGRSYLVRSETGRLYWRNRRFLRLYIPPEKQEVSMLDNAKLRRSTRTRRPPDYYQA